MRWCDRWPGDATLQLMGKEEETPAVQRSILGRHVGVPRQGELGRWEEQRVWGEQGSALRGFTRPDPTPQACARSLVFVHGAVGASEG